MVWYAGQSQLTRTELSSLKLMFAVVLYSDHLKYGHTIAQQWLRNVASIFGSGFRNHAHITVMEEERLLVRVRFQLTNTLVIKRGHCIRILCRLCAVALQRQPM